MSSGRRRKIDFVFTCAPRNRCAAERPSLRIPMPRRDDLPRGDKPAHYPQPSFDKSCIGTWFVLLWCYCLERAARVERAQTGARRVLLDLGEIEVVLFASLETTPCAFIRDLHGVRTGRRPLRPLMIR